MVLESFGVLNLWTYIAGVIFIIVLPGPNTLFVLKTGISYGIRAGYTAALGVFIGDAMLIFCSYIGVATLIRTTPVLFTLVRYLGAIYLLFLGAKILYSTFLQKKLAKAAPQQEKHNGILRRSLTLSLTNPKAILFYVSFFVQFIDYNYAHTGVSFTLLALILEFVSFIYLSIIIFSGAMIARFFSHQQRLAKAGNGLIGLLFLGFAGRLAAMNV